MPARKLSPEKAALLRDLDAELMEREGPVVRVDDEGNEVTMRTIDDICEFVGISKSRFHDLKRKNFRLARHGVPPATGNGEIHETVDAGAFKRLYELSTDLIAQQRQRIVELERQIAETERDTPQ